MHACCLLTMRALTAGFVACLNTSTRLPPPNMIAIAPSIPTVWSTDDSSDPNRHITGCRIHTPKLVLTVYQVSQASLAKLKLCCMPDTGACLLPAAQAGRLRGSAQAGRRAALAACFLTDCGNRCKSLRIPCLH